MEPETFRAIFKRVWELLEIDRGLEEIEWELIGGEITSLPVDYWRENLPYALDQCREFNKVLKTPGSINVLSNLIFPKEKARQEYLDLFAKYGDRPEMCLYTSWEPDTNRFGKNDVLFDQWRETVKAAQVEKKILDVILTRTTVEKGPEFLLETFLPLGINDFSIKMISPYGSGRAFWQPNMIEFHKMSDYLCRLLDMIPEGITFTPGDEMSGAVFRGTSYQCIGNFRYDLSVEPDGLTTFNANQTTEEASLGDNEIRVTDDDWAWKVMSDNTQELDNKLSKYHDYCFQCDYHSYCAGGWYHYRIAEPAEVRAWDTGDCPGYKKLWSKVDERYGSFNRTMHVHREAMEAARTPRPQQKGKLNPERFGAAIQGVKPFYQFLKDNEGGQVLLKYTATGKSLLQRMWAYQSAGIAMLLPAAVFESVPRHEQQGIVGHIVFGDLPNLNVDPYIVWRWVSQNPKFPISRLILSAEEAIREGFGKDSAITEDKNVELLRWMIVNPRDGKPMTDHEHPVIRSCITQLRNEERVAASANRLLA